jgi:hypothetical protein
MDINARKNLDFVGLSPDQMHCLLYKPFESPQVVQFLMGYPEQSSVLYFLDRLIAAMGPNGMKMTAKGNLPLPFCREILAGYTQAYDDPPDGIRSEDQFIELHTIRLLAEQAGFLQTVKDKFFWTEKAEQLLDKGDKAQLYFIFFETYCMRFNWGYFDAYPEARIVQMSFLFSLYMLSVFGAEFRPVTFYEDRFLQAFPMLRDEMEGRPYSTPDQQAKNCFNVRVIQRFLHPFGLIDIQRVAVPGESFPRLVEIKKNSALDRFVKFNV